MDEQWTIGRLLTWTADYLRKHGTESPRLDAEVLLSHARECQRIELYTCFEEVASSELRSAFRNLIKRRAAGTPVAYLVGHREFYSHDFIVTPDVLIPRPETEFVLVALLDHIHQQDTATEDHGESAGNQIPPSAQNLEEDTGELADSVELVLGLNERKRRHTSDRPVSICDVGTGSGVLAVCAAIHLPAATVTAIDISDRALQVARQNVMRHGVDDRIRLRPSNLFNALPADERFDYIIANPPYIAESFRDRLPRDVLQHEPSQALFSGTDGMDVLRKMISAAVTRLHPGGCLITEFSPEQHDALKELGSSVGLHFIRTLEDLSKQPRVLVFQADWNQKA